MPDLRALSLALEEKTGYDSIPTIELHYRWSDQHAYTPGDGLECVWPDCRYRSKDPEAMWKHVHFTKKHGLSFGVAQPALIDGSNAPEEAT